jgi:hypothetical protein
MLFKQKWTNKKYFKDEIRRRKRSCQWNDLVLCSSASVAIEEQFLYLVEKGVLELIVDFLSQEKLEYMMNVENFVEIEEVDQ